MSIETIAMLVPPVGGLLVGLIVVVMATRVARHDLGETAQRSGQRPGE